MEIVILKIAEIGLRITFITASTSKWYYGGKNQWGVNDNTISVSNINNDIHTTEQAKANEQKILDTITDPSKGWTEVTLNGNTFSK